MGKITIFCRKDAKRKDGTFPLYASIYTGKLRVRLCINVFIKEESWDAKSQTIRGKSKYAADTNLIISNARARLSDILVRARLSNKSLTKEEIIKEYKRLDGGGEEEEEKSESFLKFSYGYLHEIARSITYGTLLRRKGILKKVEDYDPDVTFSQITPEWLRRYASHCRDYHDNSVGTVKKNMDTLRLFYYVAMRRHLVESNPFDFYKSPVYYPDIVFLTEEEIRKMIALQRDHELSETEEKVLDCFLFMFYTGMHYSDASAVRIDDIRNGEVLYKRQKTGVGVRVPLPRPATLIVSKYAGDRKRGKVFPGFPTNQCVNRLVKELAAKAGIEKHITAKTARHTFATIFYKKTRDIGTLSKLLGHTSVKNTMIYAHIMSEDRVNGMAVFDDIA